MNTLTLDELRAWPSGKTGHVVLLGRPNTGKSTLVNTLLDYHLAAVSQKPQTTRRNCLGILTDENSQIVFIDAPGVHEPQHQLDKAMDHAISRALEEADVIVCIADPTRDQGDESLMVATRAAATRKPTILVVNKNDVANEEGMKRAETFFRVHLPEAALFRVSALKKDTLQPLVAAIVELLPEGPFLFDPEQLTDAFERDIASELIREALLESLRDEVPHAMAVSVDVWKEKPKAVHITATLHVERQSQKGIVIGQGGSMIKKVKSKAITKLRTIIDKPIRLDLFVKVTSDWRNRGDMLRDFGLAER
ncbi:MAG: GTPase Era [Lentisphaeria bacterium]|nr:GTPase Era [Lentisphaeria bacterium]